MIITPLWHTEFIVDIANTTGGNVRILVDSWLSDYVIWDLMERSTQIRLDNEKIKTIDAIYISHSHTDHIDPYTLIEIYNYASPVLILPYTLRYLEQIFYQYIPSIQIEFLIPKKVFHFKWIEITGYMFSQENITNEDDVMMIAISNDTELLFAEIDTVPDEYDEGIQAELFQIFDRKNYLTRCYLASRNELEWQLRIYDYDEHRRRSYRSEYIAGRKDDMRSNYEKFEYDEYIDMANIMTLSGFVRWFIGQWLKYPVILSSSLSDITIFPLEEIASMESDIAHTFGYEFAQKALLPGRQYRIENWIIEPGRKECPIGEILKNSTLNNADTHSGNRIFAKWPLMNRDLFSDDIAFAKAQILEILNYKFLPYWSASPVASLRSALMRNTDGAYRIEFKILGSESIIFEYSLTTSSFIEIPNIPKLRIDEDYWIIDILDFLDGKQELYSNFWHVLDPKRIYRLWTCLGANFMNNDLILAKYKLHFERAKNSESITDYVESIILELGK